MKHSETFETHFSTVQNNILFAPKPKYIESVNVCEEVKAFSLKNSKYKIKKAHTYFKTGILKNIFASTSNLDIHVSLEKFITKDQLISEKELAKKTSVCKLKSHRIFNF